MNETEILEFYKSLTTSNVIEEASIINMASGEGVIPMSIRYGIMKSTYRGVIKCINDSLYYFHYTPGGAFSIVKAASEDQKWDANRILTKSDLGCDMIKAGEGGGVPAIPGVQDEEEFLENQDDLTTDRHPGAATGMTPDLPERGKQWHEEEPVVAKSTGFWSGDDLLKGLNNSLKKNIANIKRPISSPEAKFMSEVLGKTPDEIEMGVNMNPTQKVLYQRWLGKSMRNRVGGLKKWLNGQ